MICSFISVLIQYILSKNATNISSSEYCKTSISHLQRQISTALFICKGFKIQRNTNKTFAFVELFRL